MEVCHAAHGRAAPRRLKEAIYKVQGTYKAAMKLVKEAVLTIELGKVPAPAESKEEGKGSGEQRSPELEQAQGLEDPPEGPGAEVRE